MNSKQKIKIYIFHPYSGEGGADLSISRLINGLNDKKYDIIHSLWHILGGLAIITWIKCISEFI